MPAKSAKKRPKSVERKPQGTKSESSPEKKVKVSITDRKFCLKIEHW